MMYIQPFESGTLGSERFRIPALYTLNDGSVLAAADIRYGHGSDSPNNIDIALAHSENGYDGWQYTVVNHFDDYADGMTHKNSASFIDTALAQTESGRIFVLTDVFPYGGGYMQAKKGTGYAQINGKKRLLLTDGDNAAKPESFAYYVGDSEDGRAPVFERRTHKKTAYSVDGMYCLYKDGEPLYCDCRGADGVRVQQKVFYEEAALRMFRTVYLCLRTSDDGGKTWSLPQLLSAELKHENENFFGICPGRGTVVRHNGKERVLFCVYNNHGLITDPTAENACVIYSDDNGDTWHRSSRIKICPGLIKTSESQIIRLRCGEKTILRMYARNNSNYIAYADSTDGGETWTPFRADLALEGTRNCMVSFLDTDRTVNGKQVVLCSAGGDVRARANGVIRVGLTNEDGSMDWMHTYHINDGFYGYSCLTALQDGNFALLYEDEPAHIRYMIFSVSEDGMVSEINGENVSFTPKPLTGAEKTRFAIKKKIVQLFAK